jgi:phosphate:Na+ symporter
VRRLQRLFTSPEEVLGRPQHLDATLLPVPELAVQALEREVSRMLEMAAAMEERVRAVARLGQEARRFVADLNSRPLSDEVAAALPHLMRAVQHAETIAALARRLGGAEAEQAHRAAATEWSELRMRTLEALTPVAADGAAAAVEAEAAYQAVKRALLIAAARGRTPVSALDAALLEAQAMRQMAAAVLKARRRLRAARPGPPEEVPLSPEEIGPEEPANGEAGAVPSRPA